MLIENIREELLREIKDERLPNSLLFTGERFTGKRTLSYILAQNLIKDFSSKNLNFKILSPIYLDETRAYLKKRKNLKTYLKHIENIISTFTSFTEEKKFKRVEKQINELNSLIYKKDLKEEEGENLEKCINDLSPFINESITIEQIRNIQNWSYSQKGDNKVILISQAQRMTNNAFNSLLKILEEPPQNIYFILCSRNKKLIPQTILSRLRLYNFSKMTEKAESEVIREVFGSSEAKSLDEFIREFSSQERREIKKMAEDISYFIENKDLKALSFAENYFKIIESDENFKILLDEILKIARINFSSNKIDINRYLQYTRELKDGIKDYSIYKQSKKNIIEKIILRLE